MVSTMSPERLRSVEQAQIDLRADRNLHFVVLRLNVQTLLLQSLQDSISDVEPLHSLHMSVKLAKRHTWYSPAFSLYVPSSFMRLMNSRLFLTAHSKSFGSCAGVILTAPVPNVMSTVIGSVTMGIRRPLKG